jgi:hypothetical protein
MIRRTRNGVAIAYVAVGMAVTCGFMSLAVDYGRAQMAKTELRRAADSAALASATALGTNSTVQDLAVQYAALNKCDGIDVAVDKNQDVDFIDWDTSTRTFTVLNGSAQANANAVRVWCRRTTNRQNAIPLYFMCLLGRSTCDVTASSIAAIVPPGYGLVGLNSITMKGNASASYWSTNGNVSGNAGNIASNGNITSTGSSTIHGTVWKGSAASVTGVTANSIKNLPQVLSYPNPDPAPYTFSNNSNGNITGNYSLNPGTHDFSISSNKTAILNGGVYVFHNVTISSNTTLLVNAPSTIYFNGAFTMSGNAVTSGNAAKNLTIKSATINGNGPGDINIGSGSALYATIMAPQSNVTLSGNGAIYGSIVGLTITMSGNSNIYYDLSDPSATNTGVVKLVQ